MYSNYKTYILGYKKQVTNSKARQESTKTGFANKERNSWTLEGFFRGIWAMSLLRALLSWEVGCGVAGVAFHSPKANHQVLPRDHSMTWVVSPELGVTVDGGWLWLGKGEKREVGSHVLDGQFSGLEWHRAVVGLFSGSGPGGGEQSSYLGHNIKTAPKKLSHQGKYYLKCNILKNHNAKKIMNKMSHFYIKTGSSGAGIRARWVKWVIQVCLHW